MILYLTLVKSESPDTFLQSGPPTVKKQWHLGSWTPLFFILLPIGAIYLMISPFLPVHRLGAYQKVIDKNGQYSPLSHFPRADRPDAKLIKFYYQPGMMQGGSTFVARFEGRSPEFVQAMRQQYVSRHKKQIKDFYMNSKLPGYPDRTLTDLELQFDADEKWRMISRSVQKRNEPLKEKMNQYEYVLLQKTIRNHGEESGLFISKEGNDAIFWAQKW